LLLAQPTSVAAATAARITFAPYLMTSLLLR
jgi:hypothetical protein